MKKQENSSTSFHTFSENKDDIIKKHLYKNFLFLLFKIWRYADKAFVSFFPFVFWINSFLHLLHLKINLKTKFKIL